MKHLLVNPFQATHSCNRRWDSMEATEARSIPHLGSDGLTGALVSSFAD